MPTIPTETLKARLKEIEAEITAIVRAAPISPTNAGYLGLSDAEISRMNFLHQEAELILGLLRVACLYEVTKLMADVMPLLEKPYKSEGEQN